MTTNTKKTLFYQPATASKNSVFILFFKSSHRQIDKLTNRQIDKLTNRQIDKSTNRQIDKSTN